MFENIKFIFKDGKIVEVISNDIECLNEILNFDDGVCYIGEFVIGFNLYILYLMKDILFDEKIVGSLYFIFGQVYEEMDNGNCFFIYWDLVFIQCLDYGGGEIYFDDVLICKDGIFVILELECLNLD